MLPPAFSSKLGKFENYLRSKGASPCTIIFYEMDLISFFKKGKLLPSEVHTSDILAWAQKRLKAGGNPQTIKSSLYRVKKFFLWEGLSWPELTHSEMVAGSVEGLPEPDPEWDD